MQVIEFSTLEAYCAHIHISPPAHPHFDIRRFEDNMPSVKMQIPPFRHHFFAIALKLGGKGLVQTGFAKTEEQTPCLFFNTPLRETYTKLYI